MSDACPIECGCGAQCHAAHIPMCFRPHTPRTCPALNHEDPVDVS